MEEKKQRVPVQGTPKIETIQWVAKHLKEKGYRILPPHQISPLEAFLKQQAKTQPFVAGRDGDKTGDINGARDIGKAFPILITQVMDTLYTMHPDEKEREVFDALNQYWIAIYNGVIRYDKSVIDLIHQFKDYVAEDEQRKELYAEYAMTWHVSTMTYMLVTFPIIFGLAEFDTDSMKEYGTGLNLLAACEDERSRKVLAKLLKDEGIMPQSISIGPFCKSVELFARLVEEERKFHEEQRKGLDG